VTIPVVLLDTNVVLDLLLARKPFDADAVEIASRVARGLLVAHIAATSVTTLHDIARRSIGTQAADRAIARLLHLFHVAPVTHHVLLSAVARDFNDFEDAVLDAAAELSGVDALVTRDAEGFRRSRLPVYAPAAFLSAMDAATR
jgi:predicted nucleic acid-binding protein